MFGPTIGCNRSGGESGCCVAQHSAQETQTCTNGEEAKSVLLEILVFLSSVFELGVEMSSDGNEALDLPTLSQVGSNSLGCFMTESLPRLKDGRRPRRIPLVKKRAMLDAVVVTSSLSSVTQLVAAERLFTEQKSLVSPPSSEKNAIKWILLYMYQYFLASQDIFSKSSHISLLHLMLAGFHQMTSYNAATTVWSKAVDAGGLLR
eukprot:3087996-Amphidinium_carterae.2